MPCRKDFQKVLIIGSGPIRIGQACEFDYSGTQACKALREMGYEVILANSNPATIMTDVDMADQTYIVPLDVNSLAEIIKTERPDVLLPNLGGQSGLNLCLELHKAGILKQYDVEVIGVAIETIEKGEDRIAFKESMEAIGVDMARSHEAYSVDEALEIVKDLGYPVVVRPAYTMGGEGGGLVYNEEELRTVVGRGLSASMVGQVLIEESILGWQELELEMIRDADGEMITVCTIENVDPMGVHTGDSYCVAPFLTVSHDVTKRLVEASRKIVASVGVIGGCNCQFAYNPEEDRIVVIEINPRTSRSSALASKATGLPIAFISAQLACGYTLKELPYFGGDSLADYQPQDDYVVVKYPKWNFEKFQGVQDLLGTQMQAVGEVMSVGRTFEEATQKAIRSLESGRMGLGLVAKHEKLSDEDILRDLSRATSERFFLIYEALKRGISLTDVQERTGVHTYFLERFLQLGQFEQKLLSQQTMDAATLAEAKKLGFADAYLAQLLNCSEGAIRNLRLDHNIKPTFDAILVSGVKGREAYYYSTYHQAHEPLAVQEAKSILVLGSGPNRIGQGIEFDYCCVHAALALKDLGYQTVMINCNPETVSTDYDISDLLFFEPLTVEDVLAIHAFLNPLGAIAQFGGQTPLNLSNRLEATGVKILGTSPKAIDLAEDRDQFREVMNELGIPMPKAAMAVNVEEALAAAKDIGYPLMCRPSYVLGGRGMEVVVDDAALIHYMEGAVGLSEDRPILIDKFLADALECESDAISDGHSVFVPAVLEHVERAGIHSGDSSAIIPAVSIEADDLRRIRDYTAKIAKALHVHGLMNMQFALYKGTVYVLEANPRASRTVPLVSKVSDVNMVRAATEVIIAELEGRQSQVAEMQPRIYSHYGVKEAVFPFNMFPEVDPILGPEMRSTGEVLGLAENAGIAFLRAQEAAGSPMPETGTVFMSVNNEDKESAMAIGRDFVELGYKIVATQGTYEALQQVHVPCELVKKVSEGRPNIIDAMTNRKVDVVVNTPSIGRNVEADGKLIRKAAIKYRICYFSTLAAAREAIRGLRRMGEDQAGKLRSLQHYHSMITLKK